MARRIRRPGALDRRAQAILRAVIEEYVKSATPIGSQALVARYGLTVSSATVRNILAELEGAGLLTHPHTSAGRVPTDLGYRYYVESIVERVPLPPVEQLMIRHPFGQVEFASEHWFRLAATTLATATHAAGLATAAKPVASHVRRIDLVEISERMASLILVLRESTVKQVLLNLDAPVDQEALNRVANRLNHEFADATAADVDGVLVGLRGDPSVDPLLIRVAERIARSMHDFDATTIEEVFSDGLLNVMAAPEFAQSDKLRRVFAALENRLVLSGLVGAVTDGGRVRVFIGEENPAADMHEVSLVLAPYGRPGRAVGVVGVLGPTRMSYPQAIGTVGFVSGLMNELVEHLYA